MHKIITAPEKSIAILKVPMPHSEWDKALYYLMDKPLPKTEYRNFPGRLEISNAIIEFNDLDIVIGQKLNIMIDDYEFEGLMPIKEISENVFECCVDYFRKYDE